MGKRGPCSHCGTNSTPLWRKGPKENPILCNACGTRYIRRGTFKNYLPRHCKRKLNKYLNEVKSRGKVNVFGDLLNFKIPSRKRSRMVLKNMTTPMEMFQKQLLLLWKCDMEQTETYHEEVLLSNNGNNFIPNNEIGLGAILLKPNGAST